MTGWNAVKSRVEQLNLSLNDEQVKDATAKIKELADVRTQSMEDVDMILRIYHTGIQSGDLKVGQSAVLDKLLEKVSSSLPVSPWLMHARALAAWSDKRMLTLSALAIKRRLAVQGRARRQEGPCRRRRISPFSLFKITDVDLRSG